MPKALSVRVARAARPSSVSKIAGDEHRDAGSGEMLVDGRDDAVEAGKQGARWSAGSAAGRCCDCGDASRGAPVSLVGLGHHRRNDTVRLAVHMPAATSRPPTPSSCRRSRPAAGPAAGSRWASTAHADQQLDAGLREVVAAAITQAQCFPDRFDSAVWYKLMEPRLRARVKDDAERLDILTAVYCETHRSGAAPAAAGAGAGRHRCRKPLRSLGRLQRRGRGSRCRSCPSGRNAWACAVTSWCTTARTSTWAAPSCVSICSRNTTITRRALARYNGSVGRRNYSDLVLGRWAHWTGADDLGAPPSHHSGGESRARLKRRGVRGPPPASPSRRSSRSTATG